jgi:Sensors of blue-light using FAD
MALKNTPARELHVVYISRLADGTDYTAYGPICRHARARNAALAVSGLLLFDGQRFCQWLHGSVDAVESLMALITKDPRHTAMAVLLQARLPTAHFAAGWHDGFVEAEAMDEFETRARASAAQVLPALGPLAARADVVPNSHAPNPAQALEEALTRLTPALFLATS